LTKAEIFGWVDVEQAGRCGLRQAPRLDDLLDRDRESNFCLLLIGVARPEIGKYVSGTSDYGFSISPVCHIVRRSPGLILIVGYVHKPDDGA